MLATVVLISSLCSSQDNCEFYALDYWENKPVASAVSGCNNRLKTFPKKSTGCYALVTESNKSFFLLNINNQSDTIRINK